MYRADVTRRSLVAGSIVAATGAGLSNALAQQAAPSPTTAPPKGPRVQLIRAEAYNHFEILETMANPYGIAGHAVLEQMKLKAV